MGHPLYYSSISFPLMLWDDLQVPQERYTKNGVVGQQITLEQLESTLGDSFLKVHRSRLVSVMAIHDITDKV